MFYLVGLGLGDARDITVKGLEIVKKADKVFLEAYTSILTVGKAALEEFYGRSIELADREMVEQGAAGILEGSDVKDVVLLVVGDPFGATTHTDFALRAKQAGIPYQVVHNASIMNAIGCCGLQRIGGKEFPYREMTFTPSKVLSEVTLVIPKYPQLTLYSFGETVSIPYWTQSWQPDSFFDKICANITRGLHTLCLLDIQVKEPTPESLMKKKREYMPPRFMSVAEASQQLLEIIHKYQANSPELECPVLSETLVLGVARVGTETQHIAARTLQEMSCLDIGAPLHSLVIPGKLHPLEQEYIEQFKN